MQMNEGAKRFQKKFFFLGGGGFRGGFADKISKVRKRQQAIEGREKQVERMQSEI